MVFFFPPPSLLSSVDMKVDLREGGEHVAVGALLKGSGRFFFLTYHEYNYRLGLDPLKDSFKRVV